MPTTEEKKVRYADLSRRLAALKAKSVARKRGELEKSSGQTAAEATQAKKPKKPKKQKKEPTSKLTKEEKNPQITVPSEGVVDENLRAMLDERDNIDENTNLSMFQIALVEKIREHGELGVLDLSYMIWSKAEVVQARTNPIGDKPVDLTRIVRNAIRAPKRAGIIAPAGARGKYTFVEWKKAGPRK